jgi:hypothetical protein
MKTKHESLCTFDSQFNSSEIINDKVVDFSDCVFANKVFKTKQESLCTVDSNANDMCDNLCQGFNDKVVYLSNDSSRLNINAVPFSILMSVQIIHKLVWFKMILLLQMHVSV